MFTDETSITDDWDVFQSGAYDVDGEDKKAPSMTRLFEFGAGNETRTRDPNLGKVVLYQLSYSRLLWQSNDKGSSLYHKSYDGLSSKFS